MRLLSDRPQSPGRRSRRASASGSTGRPDAVAALRSCATSATRARSSSTVRLIASLDSSRHSDRSTMIGLCVLELDEHARGARLVDVALAEPDARRAVRVAVELLVERGGLLEQGLGLLAQPADSAIS